jgi:hypothetical protein
MWVTVCVGAKPITLYLTGSRIVRILIRVVPESFRFLKPDTHQRLWLNSKKLPRKCSKMFNDPIEIAFLIFVVALLLYAFGQLVFYKHFYKEYKNSYDSLYESYDSLYKDFLALHAFTGEFANTIRQHALHFQKTGKVNTEPETLN